MPSREFTFFSIALGIGILGSNFPFAGLIYPFIVPLLVLVSGWRWAGAFLLISELLEIPYWIRSGWILFTAEQIPFKMIRAGPNETKAIIENYTSSLPSPVIQTLSANGLIIAIIVFIVAAALFVFSFYGVYTGIRRYIKTLRLVRDVVKKWHR